MYVLKAFLNNFTIDSLQKKSRKSAESYFCGKITIVCGFCWGLLFCKPFIFSTIHFLFLSQFYNFNFSQVLPEALIEIETIFYFDYWSLADFYFMTLFETKIEAKHDEKRSQRQFSLHSIFMRTLLNEMLCTFDREIDFYRGSTNLHLNELGEMS